MNPTLKAASEFLESIGCVFIVPDETTHVLRGTYKNNKITAVVQAKAEWGTDKPTNTGHNWSDDRYPYASVQFRIPTDPEVLATATHYILVSGDSRHCVLTPKSVVDAATKAWAKNDNGYVQVSNVENWTPKVVFFVYQHGDWMRDPANVWEKPKPVSMDPNEFLASLG